MKKCGILFVLLLAVLLPQQLFSKSLTDELTEQILNLQLLQMSYQELEKKSKEQEIQLATLNELNLQLLTDLATTTQKCSQLSKDCIAYETKLKFLKISLSIIIPLTIATTVYTVNDLLKRLED